MSQRVLLLIIVCLTSFFLFACTDDNQSDINQNNISTGEIEKNKTQDEEQETQEMTEADNIIPIEIEYVNRSYEFADALFIEEVAYYALGEHGEYFFVPSDDWTEEFMRQMIAVTEEGLKFAKNWLGYDSDRPITCVYGIFIHGVPQTNPNFVNANRIYGCVNTRRRIHQCAKRAMAGRNHP